MFFLEQPAILDTLHEFEAVVSNYAKHALPSMDAPLHKLQLGDFHTYGIPSQVRQATSKLISYREDATAQLLEALEQLIPKFTSFVDDLVSYAESDDYLSLSYDDKISQKEQFAGVITDLLVPVVLQSPLIDQYQPFDYSDAFKKIMPDVLTLNEQVLAIATKGMLCLLNDYHYNGSQFMAWFLAYIYRDVCQHAYFSSFSNVPPPASPDLLLTGDIYPVFWQIIQQDYAVLLQFLLYNGFAYVYQWLVNWSTYLTHHPSLQQDQALRLNTFFPGLEHVMNLIDVTTSVCANVPTAFHQQLSHVIGLVTWWTAFFSVHEAKASGAHDRYELYAARLAHYHYWIVNFLQYSRYRAVSVGYYESKIMPTYDLFTRQLVLHKQSIKFATPTYDLIVKEFASELETWKPTPLDKIRPAIGDILKVPDPKQLESFLTLANMNTGTLPTEYFTEKLEKLQDAFSQGIADDYDVLSTYDDSTKGEQAAGPASFFLHEAKKDVDASSVFGKIKYVNGVVYDYRVKVVTNQPDVVIEVVKPPKQASNTGQWQVITNGQEDYKIKVVKGGVYDFTIKYK